VKPFASAFLVLVAVSILNRCFAQADNDRLSSCKPKTKAEKLVFAKLKALPEVKDFHAAVKAKKDIPDIVISVPDKFSTDYSFQVGVIHPDAFRTYFWLVINPKTLRVYYEDFSSEGKMDIPIEKWRYWRNRPEIEKEHDWVNGELVVFKDTKHDKKKSRKTQ
jgi:hypothetical protein